jgi:hypothetical protein
MNISIMIDSSNHRDSKLFPILVHYFFPEQGVKLRILKFTDFSGDSSAQLTERTYIVYVIEEAEQIDKIVSLSPYNTNVNFSRAQRRGKNNV